MSEPWHGHHDLCSIQWSDWCDCDPQNPVNLSGSHDLDEVKEASDG